MEIPASTLEGFKHFIEEHERLIRENEGLREKLAEIRKYALTIHSVATELPEPLPRVASKEALNRSITELELSVRSENVLKDADVRTVSQLVLKTEAEVLRMKNSGRKSLNEIKEVLAQLGLRLGMTETEIGNLLPID